MQPGTSTRLSQLASRTSRMRVHASLAQQPRTTNPIRQRNAKVVSAGGAVNFVDVIADRDVSTIPREGLYREIKLNQNQRLIARKLQLFLHVDKQVAEAVASGEIMLYSAAPLSFPVVDTFAAIASGCHMSASTFGKIIAEQPEFAENTMLLKIRIQQISKVLGLKFDRCLDLLPKAPRLVSLSPKYWEGQLIQLSGLLCVDVNTARLVVQREPRILVDGILKADAKIRQLSGAMACSYPEALLLTCCMPCLLYTDMVRLAKKRNFLLEACSTHPCWMQQLAQLSLYDQATFLKDNGVPVFMRLMYVASKQQQPTAHLLNVLFMSSKEFEEGWPLFEAWAEWNTPSYLFQ